MPKKIIISIVLSVIAGFAAGYLLHPDSPALTQEDETDEGAPIMVTKDIAQKGADSAEGDTWEDEDDWEPTDAEFAASDKLRAENASLRAHISDLLEWIRNNLPEKPPAQLERTDLPNVPVLDANLELNEALADALQLNEQQYGEVTEALRKTYDDVLALRDRNTQVRQRRGNRMDITVREFSADGEHVKAQLERDLKNAMGDEKYEEFIQSSRDQLARDFHYFGTAKQSLRFRSFTDKKEGTQRINIVDRYYFRDAPHATTIKEYAGTFSELPEGYDAYIEWGPVQDGEP